MVFAPAVGPAGGIAVPGAGIAEAVDGGALARAGAWGDGVGMGGLAADFGSGMAVGAEGARAVGIGLTGATAGRASARVVGMRDAPNLGRTSSG